MTAKKKKNREDKGVFSHPAGLTRVRIHPGEKTWTLDFQPVSVDNHQKGRMFAGRWKAARNHLELRFDKPVRICRRRWEEIRKEVVRLERKKHGWTVVLHFDPSKAERGLSPGRFLYECLSDEAGGTEIIPVADLRPEMENVTVRGKVFWIGEGEEKGRLYLTDESDSVIVRMPPGSMGPHAEQAGMSIGDWFEVSGDVQADSESGETVLAAGRLFPCEPAGREDRAAAKRVELHAHTSSSLTGGVHPAGELVRTAARWGHPALAITDHGSVSSFHDAFLAGRRHGVRILYGLEAAVVDDGAPVAFSLRPGRISDETYVAFDVETTGLSAVHDRMIELAAVKLRQGTVIDTFSTLIQPGRPIPEKIRELTGITDDMLAGAPDEAEAVERFLKFAGDAVLIAHFVKFDLGFLQEAAKRSGFGPVNNPAADTLELARILFPECKNYRLSSLCEHLGIPLKQHHRALDDAAAAGELWCRILERLPDHQVEELTQLNGLIRKRDPRKLRPFHAVILAKNESGILRLAEWAKRPGSGRDGLPKVLRSELTSGRDDLLIGACGTRGEPFQAALLRPEEEVRDLARFYDYLEIHPADPERSAESERVREANRLLVRIGEELGIPVVAAGNVRYVDEPDEVLLGILEFGRGESRRDRSGARFLTTEEMLKEFLYLGERKAREVVMENPAEIAGRIGEIRELPAGLPAEGRRRWNAGDEREAADWVRRYREIHEKNWNRAEEWRLVLGCLGKKI